MSKVYVLYERQDADSLEFIGVVTRKEVAEKFYEPYNRSFVEFEVDDPELLNRIAKEGE